MQRVIFIEVNLKMIWLMDTVNTLISTVQNIKVNLTMMSKRAMAKKNG
jgi:hypothetical protein